MALSDTAYRLIGWFSTTRADRTLHPFLYRQLGGRWFTGHVLGADNVLLTTTGRHSGQPRTVALFGFEVDGRWVVVGSRGGSGRTPGWAYNLRDTQRATLQVRQRAAAVVAVELAGDEYESAFEHAATVYPGYRLYRKRARHHIPIFRLDPA